MTRSTTTLLLLGVVFIAAAWVCPFVIFYLPARLWAFGILLTIGVVLLLSAVVQAALRYQARKPRWH